MSFGDAQGSVTTADYKGWIELNSFQFGVSRGVSSGAGGAARESSAPCISEIVGSKYLDAPSPKLFQASLAAGLGTNAPINMTSATKEKEQTVPNLDHTRCRIP